MSIQGSAAGILAKMTGKATITDTALRSWQRNFDSMTAAKRSVFYTDLINKIDTIPEGYTPIPRLIERFAEIRKGSGSQNYLLTAVNPTPGEVYSAEYNAEQATRFLFGNHAPDLRQANIAQVRNFTKALTIKEYELAAASFEGTVELANRITDSLEDSDNLSEWNLVCGMLFDAVRSGIAHEVTTPAPTDENSSREFSAVLGSVADYVSNPSSLYNPAGVTSVFNSNELLFITRTSTWQTIQKAQYTAAFQAGYMRGLSDDQVVTIPDEHWPVDLADQIGVIISRGQKSTVLVVDNGISRAAVTNAPWDSVNQTLTHRSVLGINPFAAMVVITNGTRVATGGAVPVPATQDLEVLLNGSSVSDLTRGYVYNLNAVAKDANGYLAGRADVTVEGSKSATQRTWIDADSMILYVGLDEEATSLTVRAKSAINPNIQVAETFQIEGTFVPMLPPMEPVSLDEDKDGLLATVLKSSDLGRVSGNTVSPVQSENPFYRVTYAGTVGGVVVTSANFTAPVKLTQAGDTVTLTAAAVGTGNTITGVTTKVVTFKP